MLVRMSMLQVRSLSERTHQVLRVRAAKANQSLSDYVAGELDRLVAVPTMEEFWERVRLREPVDPGVSAVEVLATERAEREARL